MRGNKPKFGADGGTDDPPTEQPPTEDELLREKEHGYLLVNTITGKTTRILYEYDEDIEEMTNSYEIHIFSWEENTPEVSWE